MGRKTSVYLSDEQIERWHQSGLSLSELVSRGLDVADGLALEVGRAVLAVVSRDVARTAAMVHTAPVTALASPDEPSDTAADTARELPDTAAHTVAAAPVKQSSAARQARPAAAPEPKREKCNHPKARVLKGQCRVCMEYVGKSS